MNAKTLIPLTAAILFSICAGSGLIAAKSAHAESAAAVALAQEHIVTLPAVTVRPDAEDLAFHQASQAAKSRIVDFATVTVLPDAEDLAYYMAMQTARIVDLPTVTVRASSHDVREAIVRAATAAQQVAGR